MWLYIIFDLMSFSIKPTKIWRTPKWPIWDIMFLPFQSERILKGGRQGEDKKNEPEKEIARNLSEAQPYTIPTAISYWVKKCVIWSMLRWWWTHFISSTKKSGQQLQRYPFHSFQTPPRFEITSHKFNRQYSDIHSWVC